MEESLRQLSCLTKISIDLELRPRSFCSLWASRRLFLMTLWRLTRKTDQSEPKNLIWRSKTLWTLMLSWNKDWKTVRPLTMRSQMTTSITSMQLSSKAPKLMIRSILQRSRTKLSSSNWIVFLSMRKLRVSTLRISMLKRLSSSLLGSERAQSKMSKSWMWSRCSIQMCKTNIWRSFKS